jgi:hypothetical protein
MTCWSGRRVDAARRGSKATLVGPASRVALAGLLSFYFSGLAMSKDKDDSDDESAKPASTLPTSIWT